jgi:hypothetical protein
LDDSSQKAAAGVVEHQHHTTCVSKRVAYFEVERLGESTIDRLRLNDASESAAQVNTVTR